MRRLEVFNLDAFSCMQRLSVKNASTGYFAGIIVDMVIFTSQHLTPQRLVSKK